MLKKIHVHQGLVLSPSSVPEKLGVIKKAVIPK
jgi:hypothetical protein